MDLNIFTRDNTRTRDTGYPSIIFDRKGGIYINKLASEVIQLDVERHTLAIAQDKNNPQDWYLMKRLSSDGFKPRKTSTEGHYAFNSVITVKQLFDSLGIQEDVKSIRIPISQTPSQIKGEAVWALITSKLFSRKLRS